MSPAAVTCAGAAAVVLIGAAPPARALDLAPLWDFADPVASEQRFRAALADARGDDAIVLRTQIARTHGLRRDFERARTVLRELEPLIDRAGAEARTRYWLELGRSYASATHQARERSAATDERARAAYRSAIAEAKAGALDGLHVDALHMMAFVDTAPVDQARWAEAALAVVEASTQPAAKAWEASLRHNLGYAQHQLGHHAEALQQFERALALRERSGNVRTVRVARWMVAWTLRTMGRSDEALALQLALERDWQAAGGSDPHVYEELEHLYRARGDAERAAHYAALRQATARP